jgi:hypothetical protein
LYKNGYTDQWNRRETYTYKNQLKMVVKKKKKPLNLEPETKRLLEESRGESSMALVWAMISWVRLQEHRKQKQK